MAKKKAVKNGAAPRAHVVLQDGTSAYPVIPDVDLALTLRCGDAVLLEAQGRALLYRAPGPNGTGEQARL